LVVEHYDLDVFGVFAAQAPEQDAEELAGDEVEEGNGHQ